MGKSNRFEELAERVVPLLGGKDNITWFSHCVTRLRFTVKDHGLVDKDAIDALKCVIGSQWAGDQYQIIVGPDVEDAYAAILARGEISGDRASAKEGAAKPKKRTVGSVLAAIIDAISGCITPILPMLVGTGMLRVVLVLLVQLGLITSDNPTYVTLAFAADAGLYFLPIAIGVTGSKKFGVKLGIGIMLGGILLDPTFVQLVKDGNPGSVFGIPITSFSYGSTVFPMVMTMFVAGYVERFFAKISPKPVKSILEPTLTLLVMIPLELCLIGPLGALLGTYLTAAIMWVYDTIGFVGVAIVCCLYPILVMTGMHTTLLPFLTQSFATLGYDPFVGAAQLVSNMTQGIVSLAVAIKTKDDDDLKAEASTCAFTALVGGVTEPALYGINLKYKTPLAAAMIGNLAGGLWVGITQVFRYSLGGTNLWGIAVFVGKEGNVLNMLIGVAIGVAVAFIAAMILYRPEQARSREASEKAAA